MRVVGVVAQEGHALRAAIQLASESRLAAQEQPAGVDGPTLSHFDAATDTLYVGVALQADVTGRSAAKVMRGTLPGGQQRRALANDPGRLGLQAGEAQAMQAALALFCSCNAILWVEGSLRVALQSRLRLLQRAKASLLGGARETLPPPPTLFLLLQAAPDVQEAAQERWEQQLRKLVKSCRAILPADNPKALCRLHPQQLVLTCPPLGGGGQRATIRSALESVAGAGDAEPRPAPSARLSSLLLKLAPGAAGAAAPSLEGWQRDFSSVFGALAAVAPDAAGGTRPPQPAAAQALAAGLDPALDFSVLKCKKAAAAAREAYIKATPDKYPGQLHAAALQAAGRLYTSLARGPAAVDGARELQAACTEYWQGGHRRCEAVSLRENPCALAPHDSQTPHDSGATCTLATASGRAQCAVRDPFGYGEVAAALEGSLADTEPAARVPILVHRVAKGASGALGPGQATGLCLELHLPQGEDGGQAAAAAALQQQSLRGLCPGMVAKHAALHALPLQLSRPHVEQAPVEEFPTLAATLRPAAPPPVEKPRVLNWPTSGSEGGPTGQPDGGAGGRGKPSSGKAGKQKAAGVLTGAALLVGAEYEAAATGQRLVLSPSHLSTCVSNSLDVVSLRSGAAAAAAGAAAAQRLGPRAAEAARLAAAAPSPAAFTLSTDLPLFLELPAAELPGAGERRGGRGQKAGASSAAAPDRAQWFQLRRAFFSTPPGEVEFRARPDVQLEVAAAALRRGALPPAAPSGTVALMFRPEAAIPLPAASLCVLSLPWFYTLPQGAAGTAPAVALPAGPFKAFLAGGTLLEPMH